MEEFPDCMGVQSRCTGKFFRERFGKIKFAAIEAQYRRLYNSLGAFHYSEEEAFAGS